MIPISASSFCNSGLLKGLLYVLLRVKQPYGDMGISRKGSSRLLRERDRDEKKRIRCC